MPTENEEFEVFAKNMGDYLMEKFVIPYLQEHGYIQSYRASVVSKNTTTKTMVVQRPFDNQITIPYGDSAASLDVGDDCTVFVLGESSNAKIVGDGNLNFNA